MLACPQYKFLGTDADTGEWLYDVLQPVENQLLYYDVGDDVEWGVLTSTGTVTWTQTCTWITNANVEEWLTDSLVHLSLVQDNRDGWYEIHPLLRRYFRDKLEASPHAEPAKRRYCEIMSKKSAEMPQNLTVEIVEEFKPFLLHLQTSVGEYPQYIADEDLFWSYTGLARYYNGQGLYAIAEPYYQACLTATRTHLGDNHPDVATSLNNLAGLYYSQGRYTEAEPLYLEALDLLKRLLGDNHPNTKTCRNNLQRLRQQQKPTSLTWWQWIIVIPIVILWMPFYLLWMLTRWLVRRFIR